MRLGARSLAIWAALMLVAPATAMAQLFPAFTEDDTSSTTAFGALPALGPWGVVWTSLALLAVGVRLCRRGAV